MISPDPMVNRPTIPPAAAKLGNELEKKLAAYAGSAIAAGVGLLALTKSADAKIIYTPARINIPLSNTQKVPLDLNKDGNVDFSFANRSYRTGSHLHLFSLAVIPPNSSNRAWGKGRLGSQSWFKRFASALPAGRAVGANKSYLGAGAARMATLSVSTTIGVTAASNTGGQFPYARNRYIGLQFVIAGKIHYGWARISVPSVTPKNGISAVITGYAYETIPGKPIISGKTKGPDVETVEQPTLGQLAQGAPAMPIWSRK